jgi:hypothetical protein
MESGFLDSSQSAKDAHVPNNEPESGKVLGRNFTDRAFRLIGLNLIVLQLPFRLVPELVLSSLQLTRFFPKLMRTGSYFFIHWHSALLCRVPAHFRSIASPRWRINAGPSYLLNTHRCRLTCAAEPNAACAAFT